MYSCGILTVSDSSFYHKKEDISGRNLFEGIKELRKFKDIFRDIVGDDFESIAKCLRKWSDEDMVNLILTTGGTGFTSRDVTPEATKSVLEKEAPSISQAILIESIHITKFAMLSRGVCGIRKSTLIINLPGSPKAVKECISLLHPIFDHALDQLIGKNESIKECHFHIQKCVKTTVSTLPVDIMHRARHSTYPLLSVDNAQELVLTNTERLPPVVIKLEDSLGTVTSSVIYSTVNVPPFPASIKDGYAVRFDDGVGRREVVTVSNAGDDVSGDCVTEGKCARISTGAEVPRGCDSVVQVEDTVLITDNCDPDKELFVDIKIVPTKIGQDIRPIGNDLKIGDVLVGEDVTIGPCEIGLLAMGGVDKLECYKQPVVGVLSTGNELVCHNDVNKDNKIIDCNRPLLISFLKSHNTRVVDLGIVIDEPQAILDTLKAALKQCDVIVTTGGVSMGEKDYLKSVLVNDLNAVIHFGRIFMKPGKPTTFSTLCNEHTDNKPKLIFSLPGNPVSAFVTSYLFVVPSLRKMAGHNNYKLVPVKAKLRDSVVLDDRPEYRRCRLWIDDECHGYEVSCAQFGNQMSSRLLSCVGANALLCLPAIGDRKQLDKHSVVTVLKL